MFGLSVVFVASVCHAYYQPFNRNWLNHFEMLSLATSAMTFFCGMFTLDSDSFDHQSDLNATEYLNFASLLAALINIFYVVICVLTAIMLWCTNCSKWFQRVCRCCCRAGSDKYEGSMSRTHSVFLNEDDKQSHEITARDQEKLGDLLTHRTPNDVELREVFHKS